MMEKKPTTRQKTNRSLQADRRGGAGSIGKRPIKEHGTSGKQKRGDKRMHPSSH